MIYCRQFDYNISNRSNVCQIQSKYWCVLFPTHLRYGFYVITYHIHQLHIFNSSSTSRNCCNLTWLYALCRGIGSQFCGACPWQAVIWTHGSAVPAGATTLANAKNILVLTAHSIYFWALQLVNKKVKFHMKNVMPVFQVVSSVKICFWQGKQLSPGWLRQQEAE